MFLHMFHGHSAHANGDAKVHNLRTQIGVVPVSGFVERRMIERALPVPEAIELNGEQAFLAWNAATLESEQRVRDHIAVVSRIRATVGAQKLR